MYFELYFYLNFLPTLIETKQINLELIYSNDIIHITMNYYFYIIHKYLHEKYSFCLRMMYINECISIYVSERIQYCFVLYLQHIFGIAKQVHPIQK